MLFYKMSRNDHNLRNNPIFSGIFQLKRVMSRFLKIKKMNLSKNTPQNLTAIDHISNPQKVTPVTKP